MCIGCRTCQVACKDKNDLEVGYLFRRVESFEVGEFPAPATFHYSGACNHCHTPACVEVCPAGATYINEEDGTVQHDDEACIGCGYCIAGCPFDVPRLNPEDNRVYKCTLCVDRVTVGQKIGDGQGLCVPVHASVSGTVTAIEARPHPGGNLQTAIVIESDGRDTLCPTVKPRDPEAVAAMRAEDLIAVIREAGITGMGGAGFPTSVKLSSGLGKVDTVIVNGAECEPYITSDDRLMRETPERVVGGLRVVLQILQPKRAAIGIEQNKPEAIAAISAVLGSGIDLLPLHVRYPQGAEKVLVQAATGRKVPAGGLPADVGCLVMNIGSVSFLASYMRTGMPLTMKRVTVDGSAVQNPQNVIVPIGTKIREVMEFCGGYKEEPQKLIMGGPMMGVAVTTDELPVLKQNNGLLAFGAEEARLLEPTDCIRCGRCVAACPMNLVPAKLEKYAERKDVEMLKKLDIMTCMECGCCAYVCPAKRHLVVYNQLGKQMIKK